MLLSIITPTYKRSNLLRKNIKIIDKLYLMFKSFEWILVIERKDQETINFIKKNKRKYLKYKIGNYKNIEKSFSAGFLKSKGKYINFHGDDDFFVTENLKLINKSLFMKDYIWIIFHGTYINKNFHKIRKTMSCIKFFLLKNNKFFDLSLVNYVMTPSVFVKRNIASKLGGFGSRKRSASDYRLWLRIKNKYKPKIILKNLTNAMLSENTVSGKFEFNRYIFQAKQMIKFSKMNFFGKLLIILNISIIITYNFFFKSFFLRK